jgi:hypothetical protein
MKKSPEEKLKWWSDISPSSQDIVNDWSSCDNVRYFNQTGSIERRALLQDSMRIGELFRDMSKMEQ